MTCETDRGGGSLDLQEVAADTASDDSKSSVKTCKRPAKRAKASRRCKVSSSTSSTAALLALHAKWDEFECRCEKFPLENHCIHGLVAEAKQLREEMATSERIDAAKKDTPQCCGNKHANAAVKKVVTPEADFAQANKPFARLVDFEAQFEAKEKTVLANFWMSNKILDEAAREAQLVPDKLDDARRQFAGSAESSEESLRQLDKVLKER